MEYDIAVEAWQDDSPGPMEQLMASSEADALARCLRQLEAKQRQSIMLAFFHGLCHSELAGHMKQPLGTVKTWVRRGLERLKGCLSAREKQMDRINRTYRIQSREPTPHPQLAIRSKSC